VAANALGRLRSELGSRLKLKDESLLAFAWVVDFPMFEWNEEEGRWDAQHHPFCMPNADDIEFLERDPGRVRAAAYDVVCNGYEIASGSVRIHERRVQEEIFNLLGYTMEQAREKFSTILEAFEYGAPPHAGFAPGIERLVMMLGGTENIRDVIAFPKTVRARDLMMDAPSNVDQRQLDTLNIELNEKARKAVAGEEALTTNLPPTENGCDGRSVLHQDVCDSPLHQSGVNIPTEAVISQWEGKTYSSFLTPHSPRGDTASTAG
jgi:aspartyl-tRNA synthetase